MKNEVRPIDANATIEALRANFQLGSWNGCQDPLYQIAEDTIAEMPTLTDHFPDATKMVPLTLEQLLDLGERAENGEKIIVYCAPLKDWCKVFKYGIMFFGTEDYRSWREIEEGYGKDWLAYAYPPAHIDREAWVSVEERLPEDEKDGETVLVIVFGKPHENITLHGAIMTAGYFRDEGWVLNEYPEWEGPEVTHWMPLPSQPAELEKRLRG